MPLGRGTVSYTHLDVYKRQVLGLEQFEFRTRFWEGFMFESRGSSVFYYSGPAEKGIPATFRGSGTKAGLGGHEVDDSPKALNQVI